MRPRGRGGAPAGGRLALWAGVAAVAVLGAVWATGRGPDPGLAGRPVERFTHVHGLEIPPWAPDHRYLSTHRGLIRVDETGAWAYVSEEAHDLMGFRAHPTEEGVFYASGHPAPGSGVPNPVGFMVSEDGGRTWEPRSLAGVADFHAMAVGHHDGRVVYGWNVARDPGLYRSEDAGRTWERLEGEPLRAAGGVFALAVHPRDPDRVMAGTEGGLLESTDAGRSWEPILAGLPVTAAAWDAEGRLLAYAPHPEAGLLASTDQGRSWARLGLALGEDAVLHIAPHPADPAIVYVGTLGEALLRTADGGRTWEVMAEGGMPLEAPDPRSPGG